METKTCQLNLIEPNAQPKADLDIQIQGQHYLGVKLLVQLIEI